MDNDKLAQQKAAALEFKRKLEEASVLFNKCLELELEAKIFWNNKPLQEGVFGFDLRVELTAQVEV